MGRLIRISALVLTGIAFGTFVTRFLSLDRIKFQNPARLTDKDRHHKEGDRVQEEEESKSDDSEMFI